jgi:hypothetical protein
MEALQRWQAPQKKKLAGVLICASQIDALDLRCKDFSGQARGVEDLVGR